MIKIIKYSAEHALLLTPRPEEEILREMGDYKSWATTNEKHSSVALTAVYEDLVLACGGVRDMWEGVGEAWLLLSPEAVLHRVSIVREIKKHLRDLLNRGTYHRIQAHARMDFSVAHMFLKKLDFEEEGFMTAYYPDKMDSILYSIVRR